MLLEFTLSNWACFRTAQKFSMIASREKQHRNRVAKMANQRSGGILPSAVFFGGNGSGKSKFVQAISFAKFMIVTGIPLDARIPRMPFLLDDNDAATPSAFTFLILADERLFRYSFACNDVEITYESLDEVIGSRVFRMFSRNCQQISVSIKSDEKHLQFLEFVAMGTKKNQLFINNATQQNDQMFMPVFSWFRDCLEVIDTSSVFLPVENFFLAGSSMQHSVAGCLNRLGTGIRDLESVKVDWSNVPIDDAMRLSVERDISSGKTVRIRANKDIYLVGRLNGELNVQKLVSVHENSSGNKVSFPMSFESDGTLRLLELIPAFLPIEAGKKIYVIDELDRSLHTEVSRALLGDFLGFAGVSSRSQIIFTTHDVQLMDQSLFRRDEMWAIEKNGIGESEFIQFSDFSEDIRYDKDIRKSYLVGRIGGIPSILPFDAVASSSSESSHVGIVAEPAAGCDTGAKK